MLKVFNRYLKHIITPSFFSYNRDLRLNNNQIIQSNKQYFSTHKKIQGKKKKSQAPKVPPKDITQYMQGPEHLKKNILEVKNMQTSSEANLEQNSLKEIIIEQRTLLEQSLKQELELAAKPTQKQTLRSKLLIKLTPEELKQLNKYYMKRPLKYLQNIYFTLFVANALGLSWLEFMNSYNQIGWFYGYFTTPAATTAVALLIGYNFGFWVVRQAFHLHLPVRSFHSNKISLISTTWRNVGELSIIASQFMGLIYCLLFGCPISFYKMQLLLISTNFGLLAVNLYEILKSTQIPLKSYATEYFRIVSLSTLLILLYAIYQIQVTAGSKPQDVFDDQSYRSRVIAVHEGYEEYINYFKKKKYIMKQDEKINPQDAD